MPRSISDEIRYRLLRHLSEHLEASQSELAKLLYGLRALIERVAEDAELLPPKGIEEKVSVTCRFLRRKFAEYDVLTAEIERLSREIAESGVSDGGSKVGAL